MGDRPIIFSGSMIRALLAGTKTQTRRLAKVKLHEGVNPRFSQLRAIPEGTGWRIHGSEEASDRFTVPYAVGDRLWVREAHYLTDDGNEQFAVYACEDDDVREHLARIDGLPAYFSDEVKAAHRRLRPSIHMPRWASRLTLDVTEVRVQRLQDISEEDARAEGATMRPKCRGFRDQYDGWSMDWSDVGKPSRFGSNEGRLDESDVSLGSATAAFAGFINALHDPRWNLKGNGIWGENPWVAALTFTVTPANIDTLPRSDRHG